MTMHPDSPTDEERGEGEETAKLVRVLDNAAQALERVYPTVAGRVIGLAEAGETVAHARWSKVAEDIYAVLNNIRGALRGVPRRLKDSEAASDRDGFRRVLEAVSTLEGALSVRYVAKHANKYVLYLLDDSQVEVTSLDGGVRVDILAHAGWINARDDYRGLLFMVNSVKRMLAEV